MTVGIIIDNTEGAAFIELPDGASAGVSAAGKVRIRNNGGKVEFSEGGTYVQPVGYVLPWGAAFTTAGKFAIANGDSGIAEGTGLNAGTKQTVPKAGKMAALSWQSFGADATTVIKVHKNGAVVETITLTGVEGVDATLTTTVAAADTVGIEFDAGTVPSDMSLNLYIE